jgi:hypothetical protein
MSNNKRWDSNEKIELMKLYSTGKSYDDIGKILNRSPNAIKLRLETIVYTNLAKGKSVNMLSKMLNVDQDKIQQLYYSHKSFRQARGESVEDIKFAPENGKPKAINYVPKITTRSNIGSNSGLNIRSNMGLNVVPGTNMRLNPGIPTTNLRNGLIHKQNGGRSNGTNYGMTQQQLLSNSILNTEDKFKKLEDENRVLEEIIKNYKMKRHLKKLYVDGKLDRRSIKYCKKLFHES